MVTKMNPKGAKGIPKVSPISTKMPPMVATSKKGRFKGGAPLSFGNFSHKFGKKFARPLATGVFKSLCIFFHMPYSFFLGSSFFLPSPSFFWRVRVLGAAPWGPRLPKVHHRSSTLLLLFGSKSHLGPIFLIFLSFWTVPNFSTVFGWHFFLHLTPF